jgi:nucleoside-diphosphate-sugar epimerase
MALSDEKILLTGPAGQIAYPLAEFLAKDNEVWGMARFGDPETKSRVEAIGVKAVRGDLGDGDFSELPDDFTYVIHFAALMAPGWDFDAAYRANAEGTGLLLAHTRKAKAAIVMSTHSTYRPVDDPMHVYVETDPQGEVNSSHAPPYSMSKIAQEAVARTCARLFDLPITIARMNASYGRNGGLPTQHVDALLGGGEVTTRWDPCMYSPIHQDDINAQTEALLEAASVPATIVNWAGDEPVSVQEWSAYVGELAGIDAKVNVVYPEGTLKGSIASNERRLAITGPCRVSWRDGIRDVVESRQQVG